MNLVTLHGFLGQASDWNPIVQTLKPNQSLIPDLFSKDKRLLSGKFEDFVRSMSSEIHKTFGNEKTNLMGYSLGGRLALHLALKNPSLFSQVVLVSTHMGLFKDAQKIERRKWEAGWIGKFGEGTWEEFVNEWNSQNIFKGNAEPVRNKNDFDLDTLIRTFWDFSTARHQFSLEELEAYPGRFTWVIGERDEKYKQHLKEIQALRGTKDKYLEVPGLGHRVIFEENRAWINSIFNES